MNVREEAGDRKERKEGRDRSTRVKPRLLCVRKGRCSVIRKAEKRKHTRLRRIERDTKSASTQQKDACTHRQTDTHALQPQK